MSFNGFAKFEILGTVIKDPEIAEKYTKISVGLTKNMKVNGEWTNQKKYYNLIAFAKTAEYINKSVKKFDKVFFVCDLDIGTYEDKEGNKKPKVSLIVNSTFIVEKTANKSDFDNSGSDETGNGGDDITNLPF